MGVDKRGEAGGHTGTKIDRSRGECIYVQHIVSERVNRFTLGWGVHTPVQYSFNSQLDLTHIFKLGLSKFRLSLVAVVTLRLWCVWPDIAAECNWLMVELVGECST